MKTKRTLFALLCLISLIAQAHASSIWEAGSQWDVYYTVEGESSTAPTDEIIVTYRLLPAFDNYMALEKTFTINDMVEYVQIQGYIRNAGDSIIYVRPVLDDGSIGDECLLYDFREPYEYGNTVRYGVMTGEVKEEFIDWQEDTLDYYMMNNGDMRCLPAWKGIIYQYGYLGGPMDLFLLEAAPGKFTSGKNNKPKPTNISHVIFSTKGGHKSNGMNYEEDDIIVTYNAMLKEATTWECMAVETERPDLKNTYTIQVMGDTLIGNRRCKQVYSPEYDVQKILFEEGRKVYIVNADGNPEVLLDFNLQEGDHWLDDVATVVSVDNQENLGYDYRTITIDTGLDCQSYFEGDTSPWAYNLIEGIGVSKDQHLKQHFISEENTFSYMLRCWKDDTLVYQVAQEYEYVPFVREGVKWVYKYTNEYSSVPSDPNLAIGTVYLTLEIKGDTVINGKTYKAMHKYYGDAINSENDTVPIYLREEEKVVYGFVPDGVTYSDCPIGNRFEGAYFFDALCSGEEFILYDFRDPVTYWDALANSDDNENYYKPLYTDAISIGDNLAKRYVGIMGSREFYQIEGIGVDAEGSGYTLFPFRPMASGAYTYFQFSHMIKDGEIIYKGVNYKEPEPEEYVPFVREGIKWIYYYDNPFGQDVLDMDEGIQYYCFEMKGDVLIGDKYYKPVVLTHYLDDGTKKIEGFIPVYLREENKVVYAIQPDGVGHPQNPVGIDGCVGYNYKQYLPPIEEFILYDFNDPISFYDSVFYEQNHAIFDQEIKFVEYLDTDTILVGKYQCKRYHYKSIYDGTYAFIEGYQGRIIEGIGYDGYAGMPLFYFQNFITGFQVEYHLSHVIEDDQIIYKGAYYKSDISLGINEVMSKQNRCSNAPYYYNLMGQPVGKELPTTPGIYIHQGKKIVVR
jgi:hypothetical protein